MTRYSRKKNKNLRLKKFRVVVAIILLIAGVGYGIKKITYDKYLEQAQTEKVYAEQTPDNFIKVIAPIAQKASKPYGIFPSITIAQACVESDYGQSKLARKYNNLFGVKGTDPNHTKVLKTKEYVKGHWKIISSRFQVYDTYKASIKAHTKLFINGTTWNPRQYRHVLKAKDYQSQARALVDDGYATDPGYAEKIIYVIKKYNLTQYD